MKKLIRPLTLASLFLIASCGGGGGSKNYSSTTGWKYNDPDNGGFQVIQGYEQPTGPGLVLIEGGSFTMGRVEQDVLYDWNNVPRRVTVSSFYMDETEIRNVDYREYLYWLSRVFMEHPEIRKKALPDTLVWRSKMAYNEPYVEYYFRHPAYNNYPLVGVSWVQANDYCSWRTDRVNEGLLIDQGILQQDPNQINEENFNTDAYLAGQYEGIVNQLLPDLDPRNEFRKVKMEDGILLPKYRLPTEAEWEYAAWSLIGNTYEERIYERRLYPWDGHNVRHDLTKYRGQMRANFVRGRGDYMGVSGDLNDNASITAPVDSYWPNDYGLYCMAGNVNEWVADVYRPMTFEDVSEFRPFRGNVFTTNVKDNAGRIAEKLDYVQYDYEGIIEYLEDYEEQAVNIQPNDRTLLQDVKSKTEEALEKSKVSQSAASQIMTERLQSLQDEDPEKITIGGQLFDGISKYIVRTPGKLQVRNVKPEEAFGRQNYTKADYRNYLDGDHPSSVEYNQDNAGQETGSQRMYKRDSEGGERPFSLIDDEVRVYKGGSWKDRAYWMVPGTRRYLHQDKATDDIGFRCAMTRVGSPGGLGN